MGRDRRRIQLHPHPRAEHLPQVSEQAEAGDIRAGTATVAGQQRHQRRLIALHRRQSRVDPSGLRRTLEGSGKQNTAADGTGQHQHLTGLERPLAPVALRRRRTVHGESQRQAAAIAALQGVPADQHRAERIQNRAHPRQGLQQQLLLQMRCHLRQGHNGLNAADVSTAGPEIAAGVQGGEPGVQPWIGQQGWKTIHALQQQRPSGIHADQGRVLSGGWIVIGKPGQTGEGRAQGCSGQLGGAAAAGHRLGTATGCHSSAAGKARHEVPIDPILPAPEPAAGAEGQRAVGGDGPRTITTPAPISQQLQGHSLGPPAAQGQAGLGQAALQVLRQQRGRPHRPDAGGRAGGLADQSAVSAGK